MGIYIKGMKMPKDDEVIRFIKLLNGKTVAVKEKVKSFNMYDIVEVTEPHGRLIGEDVLARKIVESNYGVDFINKATALIMDTPTIIEAEGE